MLQAYTQKEGDREGETQSFHLKIERINNILLM